MATCYRTSMKLRIKELRKAKGLTQKQLAEMVGCSVSYMTEMENATKQINARRLDAVAKALRVDVRDLLGEPEQPGPHAEITQLWARIPEWQKPHLLDILRAAAELNAPMPRGRRAPESHSD